MTEAQHPTNSVRRRGLKEYFLARFDDAPPAVRAKASVLLKVNTVIAVLLAINAALVEPFLAGDVFATVVELAWIAIIGGAFALLRRGRYTAASNITIAVVLINLCVLGFEDPAGGPSFVFAKVSFLLTAGIVYAFLVGVGRWPAVLATGFSLAALGILFCVRLAHEFPGGPGAAEYAWLVSTCFVIVVIGYMAHVASTIYLDAIAVAQDRLQALERDIELRRREQEERAELEDRLRQSEKMDAIGHLAGGIAHDFNNQLTGILGYAELLQVSSNDPELAAFAEHIVRASRRSADLTRQLLAFARKGNYQVAPVNIDALIGEVVALLERSIDKRITIRTDLKARISVVMGDATQLQSALLNLAINARDAMPNGGEIVLASRLVEANAPDRKESPTLARGPWLRVSVTDTGTGMSDETMKRIFEPFFTTKEQGKGTGMGLAAVYGAVQIHKGAITVDSTLGHGTTFEIDLPVATVDAPEKTQEAHLPEGIRGTRVLIVDDERDVRELLSDMLRRAGCQVRTCADGIEAIALFTEAWHELDVVILDMVLPRMGGRDIFAELRKIDPNVNVLLASGFSLDGETQALLDAGARGFLEKPFHGATLVQMVGACTRRDLPVKFPGNQIGRAPM